MDAMNCQSCQAALLPTTTAREQLVRCGGCGNTFLPLMNEKSAIEKTDRMAKWSFWLGLSSLVLLMFTGIPALVLGIRSLRRMRFRAVDRREKFQALTGTLLGLVFGVFGGTCAISIAVLAGYFFSSFEVTSDPEKVKALTDSVATFDNSLELIPMDGVAFLNFKILQYADQPKKADAKVRMLLLEFHMQPNPQQINTILKDKFVGNKSEYLLPYSEKVDWTTSTGANVKLDIYEHVTDADDRVLRYSSLQKSDMSWFGISITFQPTDSGITEEDVKKLFQSLDVKLLERQK